MRKFLIYILLTVLTAAIVYLAVAYYMGYVAENKIRNLTGLQQSEFISIDLKNYKRGIFSSTASFEIQIQDYGMQQVDLNIVHRPIIKASDIDNQSDIYFLSLLLDINIYNKFLNKTTDIFRNVSIINLYSPIKLNVKLKGFSKDIIKVLGLNNKIVENNPDAIGEINFDKNNINFLLYSDNHKQILNNSNSIINNVNNANYKIELIIFSKNKYQSNINIELDANKILSDHNADEELGTILELNKPKIQLNYYGKLNGFIDILRQNKDIDGLINILKSDKNIVLNLKLFSDNIKIINKYKEEFVFDKLNFNLDLENLDSKIINSNLSIEKILLNTKTEQAELDNFKFNLGTDLNYLIIYNYDIYDVIYDTVLASPIESSLNRFNNKISFDKFVSNGILLGNLNLNDFKYNININKQKNNQDNSEYILDFNTNIGKSNINYQGNNKLVKINSNKFNINANLNLSNYLKILKIDNSFDNYNNIKYGDITSKINIDLPSLEVTDKSSYVNINNFIMDNDFKLDSNNKGFLNNKSSIDNISLEYVLNLNNNINKQDRLKLKFNDIKLSADMQQSYYDILTGNGKFSIDNLDINLIDNDSENNLAIKSIVLSNKIKLDNNILNYDNNLNVNNFLYNKNNIGNLNIDNNIYNINIDDYLQTIDYINNISNRSYDNDFISSKEYFYNVFKQGLDSENIIVFNNKEDQKNIQIYNLIKLKPITETEQADKNLELLNRVNLVTKINFREEYINNLLNIINDKVLKDLYKLLTDINLFSVNNKISEVNITYDKKLLINNKTYDYWVKLIDKINKSNKYNRVDSSHQVEFE